MNTPKPISATDSHFIDLTRFSMIVALVIHHIFQIPSSGFYPRESLFLDTTTAANLLNAFFHWASMSAVPVLSILSGFLFFSNSKSISSKIIKRGKSIFLPWLLWGIIWFSFAYLLFVVGNSRGLFEWANYGFNNPSIMTLLNGVLGITKHPFAFQFWFIHDLVLTVLLAPVILFLLNRIPYIATGLLAIVWILNLVGMPFFSGNVLMFFVIGSLIAIKGFSFEQCINALLPFKYLFIAILTALILGRTYQYIHPVLESYAYLCVLRIFGVLTCFSLIGAAVKAFPDSNQKAAMLAGFSFFIFATHYPVIEIVKTIIQRVPFQSSSIGQVISFLVIPLATVIICLAIAKITKMILPKVFGILNGGR
ncbi:MAG: acyltransferase family protein [Cellvibrionaceae bacterium]